MNFESEMWCDQCMLCKQWQQLHKESMHERAWYLETWFGFASWQKM